MKFISSQMSVVAPNVSALLGADVAARLIAETGGIRELANVPACNTQVIGQVKRNLATYTVKTIMPHRGVIAQCDLVARTPKSKQTKVMRLVANKVALAARTDAHQTVASSAFGQNLYEFCSNRIEKWLEPPPARPPKPLPLPDDKPRKKRGGKRYRKMREKYKVTETQRMQNRLSFNPNKGEEMIIDGDGNMVGLGMLTEAGDAGGRLRTLMNQTKATNLEKLNKRMARKQKRVRLKAERTGNISGLRTSVVFTSVQGIELADPNLAKKRKTMRYFQKQELLTGQD